MGFGDIVAIAGRSLEWIIVDLRPRGKVVIAAPTSGGGVQERTVALSALVLIEKADFQ